MTTRAMKCLFSLFAMTVFVTSPTPTAGGTNSWTFVAPFPDVSLNDNSFPSSVVVVDPTNADVVYVATTNWTTSPQVARVFKSTDGGATSNVVFTTDRPIVGLVVDPSMPATLYLAIAITGGPGAGLYKSIDGGASWALSNLGLLLSSVNALAIDPLNPSTLYAVGHEAVYKSVNGAASWNVVLSSSNTSFERIAVDPSNSATVYVAAYRGILWKTSDGGSTWQSVLQTQAPNAQSLARIKSILVDPGNSSSVLVATDEFWGVIWKS